MKTLSALLVYILSFSNLSAQDFTTKSLSKAGNGGWDILSDLTFDSDGNYYITGSYTGTFNLQDRSATSLGERDIFLVKLNSNHEIQWLKNIGGPGDEHAYSLICDVENNVYLTGAYSQTLNIGGSSAQGITDLFVTKYNSEGNNQWVKIISSPSPVKRSFLQIDTEGSIWLAGNFTEKIEFEGGSLDASSQSDIFVLQFSNTGSISASFNGGNPNRMQLNDFIVDANNNFYFTGYYEKQLILGSYDISSHGKKDAFICKYNSNGDIQWLQTIGGYYDDEAKSFALDTDENLIVIGDFQNKIAFDEEETTSISSTKAGEVFIASYSAINGNLQWKKALGGNSSNYCTSISIGNNDKFYISGSFKGRLNFLDKNFDSENLSKDVFVIRCSSDGSPEDLFQAGGTNEDQLFIGYSEQAKGLFIAGFYSYDFNLNDHSIADGNYKDIVFGKIVDCYTMALVDLEDEVAFCQGSSITLEAPEGYDYYEWNETEGENLLEVNTPGTYTLIAGTDNGCITSDDVSVIMNTNPVVYLGPDIELPIDGYVYLAGNEGNNLSYDWTGGKSCRLLYVSNILEPTPIQLTITDENGCVGNDEIIISPYETIQEEQNVLKSANGPFYVNNNENEEEIGKETIKIEPNKFIIFPNPTKGKITIGATQIDTETNLAVFNIQGNLIHSIKNIKSFPVEVDLNEQPKGFYILKLSNKTQAKNFKIIYH